VDRLLRRPERWRYLGQQQPAVFGVGPVASDANWPHGDPTDSTAFIAAFSAAASATGSNNGSNGGFIGGGQIGYNWQFYNSFVAGLEADIQGIAGSNGGRSAIRVVPVGVDSNDNNSNYIGVTSARGNLQYIGTVRGRLGWLATPTLLLYGTGGLAYGGVTLNTYTQVTNDYYSAEPGFGAHLPPSFGGVNFSNTQVGWTAGGGLEWMFFPNWSAKVEYLYYDLGTVTQNFAIAVPKSGLSSVSSSSVSTSAFDHTAKSPGRLSFCSRHSVGCYSAMRACAAFVNSAAGSCSLASIALHRASSRAASPEALLLATSTSLVWRLSFLRTFPPKRDLSFSGYFRL
jgi:opacity protein-like surface antigen